MTIDFNTLPPPDVVQVVTYDAILARNLAAFKLLAPDYSGLELESDPVVKLIQNVSAREYLLLQRINEAAKQRLLLLAKGVDLDYIGEDYGVSRLVVVEENLTVSPPIYQVMESDDAYRTRIRDRIAGWSTAGTEYHYKRYARLNQPEVEDVAVYSPLGGIVRIALMGSEAAGGISPEVLAEVTARLNQPDVRATNDTLQIVAATPVGVVVTAKIWLLTDTPMEVFDSLEANFATSFKTLRTLGRDVTRAWVTNQLAVDGVYDVEVTLPSSLVTVARDAYPVLTSVTLEYMGRAT